MNNSVRIAVAFSIAALILLFLFLFAASDSTSITVGHTIIGTNLLWLYSFLILINLAFLASGVLFVIQGFRVHWGWGLVNLIIPLAIIVFCIKHPREAIYPLIILGFGVCLLLVLLLIWAFP